LHRRELALQGRAKPVAAPVGVVSQAVRFTPALEPPRDEWFIAGTEQSLVTLAAARGSAQRQISSPADHTVFALDPDIPAASQQLRLSAVAGTPANWSWRMDDKRLGPARTMSWPMWPGPHRLALVDQAGKVVEAVSFEVRGVEVKPKPRSRVSGSQAVRDRHQV